MVSMIKFWFLLALRFAKSLDMKQDSKVLLTLIAQWNRAFFVKCLVSVWLFWPIVSWIGWSCLFYCAIVLCADYHLLLLSLWIWILCMALIVCFSLWVLWTEGHTTVTCPHRVATEYGVIPATHKNTRNALEYAFERQIRPRIPPVSLHYLLVICETVISLFL